MNRFPTPPSKRPPDQRLNGAEEETLLAIDLGLRSGFALYGASGRLVGFRSTNFGTMARLKRGAPGVLDAAPGLVAMVLEGGGAVAEAWEREAAKRGISARRVSAEVWRERLLRPSQRAGAGVAKKNAVDLAMEVIRWSGLSRPRSLRHDAAEAVLAGLWGVLALGWLDEPPPEIFKG